MAGRRSAPSAGPYRGTSGPVRPVSPNVDEELFAVQWHSRLLLPSLFFSPYLLIVWFLDDSYRVDGVIHRLTFAEKTTICLVWAAWIAVLLLFRARQRQHERAILRELTRDDDEAVRLRVTDADPDAADELEPDAKVHSRAR